MTNDGGGASAAVGRSKSSDSWPQPSTSARAVVATVLTIAPVIAGVAIRWCHLGRQSLWWDEGFTAWASALSPADIVRFARNDDQPPLFYLLQRYWGAVFGNSEYRLRALSAFFGTLSLVVFYFLAKKVLREALAVALAMWLFAFSITQVLYSQEARAYVLGPGVPVEKELMIMDDCSTDGTREPLQTIGRCAPERPIRILYHDENRGKGRRSAVVLQQCRATSSSSKIPTWSTTPTSIPS